MVMLLLTWLARGGGGIARTFAGLWDLSWVAGAVVQGMEKAAATKGRVDRNVDGVLGMLGLPSKADYNRLLSKVEVIQGSLVNLNIKIDRLLASRDRPRREPPEGEAGAEKGPDPASRPPA